MSRRNQAPVDDKVAGLVLGGSLSVVVFGLLALLFLAYRKNVGLGVTLLAGAAVGCLAIVSGAVVAVHNHHNREGFHNGRR